MYHFLRHVSHNKSVVCTDVILRILIPLVLLYNSQKSAGFGGKFHSSVFCHFYISYFFFADNVDEPSFFVLKLKWNHDFSRTNSAAAQFEWQPSLYLLIFTPLLSHANINAKANPGSWCWFCLNGSLVAMVMDYVWHLTTPPFSVWVRALTIRQEEKLTGGGPTTMVNWNTFGHIW